MKHFVKTFYVLIHLLKVYTSILEIDTISTCKKSHIQYLQKRQKLSAYNPDIPEMEKQMDL